MAKTEVKVKAKRGPRVDMETFITAWETSDNVKEVAQKTGMQIGTVQARASKYRNLEKGPIPLKNMQRGGGAKLDRSAALALIAKLRNTTVEKLAEKTS